jgi:GNAT superfamily N-acetyltransferase
MTGLAAPRKLAREDSVAGFRSGASELDQWIVRFAWENQAANNAVTYVVTHDGRVVGFYAIAMSAVMKGTVPQELHPEGRPAQIPCMLLARLAVSDTYQRQGIGANLLRDALLRAVQLSDVIGAAAVLVHCRDDSAKSFYLANGDFLTSPLDPLQLMVTVKTLRRYLG